MDESWGDWQVEDLQVFDTGDDRVAGVFRMVGAGKSSGVPIDQTVGMAIRFRNGKVWRMRSYPNPGDALEAVGLSG
jgi:ketosteroid isomerase-like protein